MSPMTTEDEHSGGRWKGLVEQNVEWVYTHLRNIKDNKERSLNHLIDRLMTEIKEGSLNHLIDRLMTEIKEIEEFDKTKAEGITSLRKMLSSFGLINELDVSRINTLVIQPPQASINALVVVMQCLVNRTKNVAASENSSSQTVDDSAHQPHSLERTYIQGIHDKAVENQDNASHNMTIPTGVNNPTENQNRKRSGISSPSMAEQSEKKRPRTTASRGRGRKRTQVVTDYPQPSRRKAEQSRPYSARTLFHSDLPSKEFVFKCYDIFWVLRCNDKACVHWIVQENPFEESRAIDHFKGHDTDKYLSEEYIFKTYAYSVLAVEEKWVQQRAKGRNYHCIPQASLVWTGDSNHQREVAQQTDSVQGSITIPENIGFTATEEVDCETVDLVRNDRHNLREINRPNYRLLNYGTDPLDGYEDTSGRRLSPYHTTTTSSGENLTDFNSTSCSTNTVATAQNCLSHMMNKNTPIVALEDGLPREPSAPHSNQLTSGPALESRSNIGSPIETMIQGFRPVNENNLQLNAMDVLGIQY